MFIDSVTPSVVINTVNKLKSKSSYGHDEISTKLLNETIKNITTPITRIMSRSIISCKEKIPTWRMEYLSHILELEMCVQLSVIMCL